jgi:hypothetical protein
MSDKDTADTIDSWSETSSFDGDADPVGNFYSSDSEDNEFEAAANAEISAASREPIKKVLEKINQFKMSRLSDEKKTDLLKMISFDIIDIFDDNARRLKKVNVFNKKEKEYVAKKINDLMIKYIDINKYATYRPDYISTIIVINSIMEKYLSGRATEEEMLKVLKGHRFAIHEDMVNGGKRRKTRKGKKGKKGRKTRKGRKSRKGRKGRKCRKTRK